MKQIVFVLLLSLLVVSCDESAATTDTVDLTTQFLKPSHTPLSQIKYVEKPKTSTANTKVNNPADPNLDLDTPSTPNNISEVVPSNSEKDPLQFGPGGLVTDLASYADITPPKFFTASHVDVSRIEHVSKFRSRAGHDYSDSFESCCSMKHYFQHLDFYNAALDNPIYAGHDGVVLYVWKSEGQYSHEWRVDYEKNTGKKWPEDRWDYQMYIRPDAAPYMWVRYHHVMPVDGIIDTIEPVSDRNLFRGNARPATPGYRVKAGDLIGHGLGEISLEQHLDGNGVPSPCVTAYGRTESRAANTPACLAKQRFHSMIFHLTDEVFAEYQKLGEFERNDFIIPASEVVSSPYVCEGEKFAVRGTVDEPDVYVRLQGADQEPAQKVLKATENNVLASKEASGDGVLGPLKLESGYGIVVSSSSGSISISLEANGEKRKIFNFDGDTPVNKQLTGFSSGNVSLHVEADVDVRWQMQIISVGI